MVRAIEEWEEVGRARAQKVDIRRRQNFLTLNKPTQSRIVSLLNKMVDLVYKSPKRAQEFVFREIFARHDNRRGFKTDRNGVDWGEVYDQVKASCFSDSDMEGLIIAPRRVELELTIYQSLMELENQHEDF